MMAERSEGVAVVISPSTDSNDDDGTSSSSSVTTTSCAAVEEEEESVIEDGGTNNINHHHEEEEDNKAKGKESSMKACSGDGSLYAATTVSGQFRAHPSAAVKRVAKTSCCARIWLEAEGRHRLCLLPVEAEEGHWVENTGRWGYHLCAIHNYEFTSITTEIRAPWERMLRSAAEELISLVRGRGGQGDYDDDDDGSGHEGGVTAFFSTITTTTTSSTSLAQQRLLLVAHTFLHTLDTVKGNAAGIDIFFGPEEAPDYAPVEYKEAYRRVRGMTTEYYEQEVGLMMPVAGSGKEQTTVSLLEAVTSMARSIIVSAVAKDKASSMGESSCEDLHRDEGWIAAGGSGVI